MNKKTLFIRDFLVYGFVLLLYFSGFLSITISNDVSLNSSLSKLEENACLLLETNEPEEVVSIYSKDDRYVAFYSPSQNVFFSNRSNDGSLKKENFVSDLETNKDETISSCLYRTRCKEVRDLYIKVGVDIPSYVIATRYFLFIGTPFLLLVFLASYFYMRKKINDSFLALNSQVRRLEEVSGLSHDETIHEDSIELLTKAVRLSRKAVDKELKEAELARQKNDFILDSFSQALVVMNGDFEIEIFNKKAAEVFAIAQKDALNHEANFLERKEPELARKMRLAMNALIPSHTFERIDDRIYEASIEPLDFSWTQGEKVNGVSLLLVDVTENYHSSTMKRDFFANASHELKSPLTSILGYQEMIKNGILVEPSEINSAVEKTIKDAKRMNKIIMDMLTLSNLENENLRSVEEIPVSFALDEILSSIELLIREKNIKVIHRSSDMKLKMNPDDFDKLFRNIIENAVRYNKENGKIFIEEDFALGDITIRDTGIGIKKEDCSRIFERFYRVDKARSRENGGTGLGLAIVKYVCSYYDFSIEVKSVFGEGTSFIIHTKK